MLGNLAPKRKALITGITGQDGSYLAEFLLEKGYEVHGIVRRVAIEDPTHRLRRILSIKNQIQLHAASLESFPSLYRIIHEIQPDECYHLAAQSFVANSFEDEFSTLNTNINGTHYMLAALKDMAPHCRFYFAGSSEMFGKAAVVPQDESTVFHPRSAYGISKVAGFDITRNYREAYNMHASSGILYNHESPRRGFEFVTRKITRGLALINCGTASELTLGNLDAKRDWGYAKEYVEAMWLMLQQDTPDDYVVATGKTHSVREFIQEAAAYFGFEMEWNGKGLEEVGVDKKSGRVLVKINSTYFRPAEVEILLGNSSKAQEKLRWRPRATFEELVKIMCDAELRDVEY